MRFSLALFSGQCSVLCQNCCHGYQLINHLQVVLDVVSLFFFPQHNIDNLLICKPTQMKNVTLLESKLQSNLHYATPY